MIKTQESFDGCSLAKLYNVLKAHESEINDIAEESKLSLGGLLALVSKVVGMESEPEEEAKDSEEGFLFNSDDESVAY